MRATMNKTSIRLKFPRSQGKKVSCLSLLGDFNTLTTLITLNRRCSIDGGNLFRLRSSLDTGLTLLTNAVSL